MQNCCIIITLRLVYFKKKKKNIFDTLEELGLPEKNGIIFLGLEKMGLYTLFFILHTEKNLQSGISL